MKVQLLILLCLFSGPIEMDLTAFSYALRRMELITEYVNKDAEILLMPTDHITFHAATCGRYDTGYDVTAKIDLPENPDLSADHGVVLFALSHSNTSVNGVIPAADIICSVDDPLNYKDTCTGKAGTGDIYIHTRSNERPDVTFAITVTFTPSQEKVQRLKPKDFKMPKADAATDLVQVFNHRELITIPYGNATIIHVKICPNAYTSKQYKYRSAFLAADGQSKSIIAQAICKNETCSFDAPSRIAADIFNLPVNSVTTGTISLQDLYIYALCYGGVLSDGDTLPVGSFKYGGSIVPNS